MYEAYTDGRQLWLTVLLDRRSAQLIGHPETGEGEAEDSHDTEREKWREAAVVLGDSFSGIAPQKYDIRHAGEEYPGNDVEDVVLFRVQG
jgi:hypothetical protein